MPGTLYVVATPLGNLGDLTERAGQVLREVEIVAAEDTRRARTLLAHVHATPQLYSCHAHSPESRLEFLGRRLTEGADMAYVSDAGTPAVCDPGVELVKRAREVGATVIPLPGPSAVAAALSVSGLPADRYMFVGFVPRKGKDRTRMLAEINHSVWTVVMFEAANRLVRLLTDLSEVCGGDRIAVVARELTKIHEEARSGNLDQLSVYYGEHPPRGEVTVVVSGRTAVDSGYDREAVLRRAREMLEAGSSRRDAAAQVAEEFSLSRNEVYDMVIRL